MSKSVYSVIMTDELVDELDRAAYKRGLSRSAMLDKIIADYLTMETPASRIENIFSEMEKMIMGRTGMRFINQPSLTMASVRSALTYKYNPTVKYAIELFSNGEDLGAVKVSLRSQSPTLISLMEDFYKFFCELESKYLGEREYYYEDFKFQRVLKRVGGVSAEKTGEAIADFIGTFDYLLNAYFSGLDDLSLTEKILEREYAENLCGKILV